jgi:hypothetical protein
MAMRDAARMAQHDYAAEAVFPTTAGLQFYQLIPNKHENDMRIKIPRTDIPDDEEGLCPQCAKAGDFGAERTMRFSGSDRFYCCCDKHNVFWGDTLPSKSQHHDDSEDQADAAKLRTMWRVKPCYLPETEIADIRWEQENRNLASLCRRLSLPQRELVLRLLCELTGTKITADGNVVKLLAEPLF